MPESQDNVWYTSRSSTSSTVHCYAVWYLRTHAQLMSGRLSIGILIPTGNFGRCAFRVVFQTVALLYFSLHYGCMWTNHSQPHLRSNRCCCHVPSCRRISKVNLLQTRDTIFMCHRLACKLKLFDVDTRPNDKTGGNGSKRQYHSRTTLASCIHEHSIYHRGIISA